jgi:hypothetical protein
MLTCTVIFVLGCNWPFLAVVKHVNKLIEFLLLLFSQDFPGTFPHEPMVNHTTQASSF